MTTEPGVVVIDDDPSVRKALDRLLRKFGFQVELFSSPTQFLESRRPDGPGCIVCDIRFSGKNGLDLQSELVTVSRLPIIFITGYGTIPMSVRAMKAGAVEFLTKPFRDQDLLDAIALALERDGARRSSETQIAGLRERFASLTARERQVMGLVAAGRLNKQIAAELGVSEVTVKIHRSRVMHKMRASGLAELVRMADRLGSP
jgi:FixJ family two-component response regulator